MQPRDSFRQDTRMLKVIKLLHSAVWLFMVSCILLIPWLLLNGGSNSRPGLPQ